MRSERAAVYMRSTPRSRAKPRPRNAFPAAGDLAILPDHNFAYATVSTDNNPQVYDRVIRIPVAPGDTRPAQTFVLRQGDSLFTGNDGLALANQGRDSVRLMVTVDAPAGTPPEKQVLLFDALEAEPSRGKKPARVSLGENTPVALAYNPATRSAMATLESSHRIGLFDPASGQSANASFPAGIMPRAIAVDASGRDVYVLNTGSNTVLKIPAGTLQPSGIPNPTRLAEYRAAMAEAFADLFAAMLQHLKDCFCDLLLRNCPDCEKEDKLYLASIHIRDREVYHVCNFSERKHVHTFPKLFYWLSLVPVLPLVNVLVERLCCLIIPELAARFKAPRPSPPKTGPAPSAASGLSLASVLQAFTGPGRLEISSLTERLMSSSSLALPLLTDFVTDRTRTRESAAPMLTQSDLKGLTPGQAREKLGRIGIASVSVEKFNPSRLGRNLIDVTAAPARIRAGDRVTLVEQDGVVRFVRISSAASAEVEVERTNLDGRSKRASVASQSWKPGSIPASPARKKRPAPKWRRCGVSLGSRLRSATAASRCSRNEQRRRRRIQRPSGTFGRRSLLSSDDLDDLNEAIREYLRLPGAREPGVRHRSRAQPARAGS